MLGLDLLVGALIAYGFVHIESPYWPAVLLFWVLELAGDLWALRRFPKPRRPAPTVLSRHGKTGSHRER
jgi:hypothetical protein